MADDNAKLLKLRQNKAEIKEETGKITAKDVNTKVPKSCATCQNPRWDKTPRKS